MLATELIADISLAWKQKDRGGMKVISREIISVFITLSKTLCDLKIQKFSSFGISHTPKKHKID